MNSEKAEPYPAPRFPLGPALPEAMARWKTQPSSHLSHHGARCCDMARAWFTALDHSLDAIQGPAAAYSGPRWILDHFTWGPSPWPLHWCEAVELRELDCGALSAMTREIYHHRNVTATPAQVIQCYSSQAVASWRIRWGSYLDGFDWLAREHIYHEAVAVFCDGAGMKVWDPTNAWWLADNHPDGYGSALEIKVAPPSPAQDGAVGRWGNRLLRLGSWNRLEETSIAVRPGEVRAVEP